jgi:hypothetical protein
MRSDGSAPGCSQVCKGWEGRKALAAMPMKNFQGWGWAVDYSCIATID